MSDIIKLIKNDKITKYKQTFEKIILKNISLKQLKLKNSFIIDIKKKKYKKFVEFIK